MKDLKGSGGGKLLNIVNASQRQSASTHLNRHRVVEFPAATSVLTGVMANPAADSGKRVALADCFHSIQIFTSTNMRYIFGNVNANRTGVLTGGNHQRITNRCRTFLFLYMCLIFIFKIFESGRFGLGQVC